MTVTAKVSEVNYKNALVKVIHTDRDNRVSDWLPMMSHEYEMPDVGDVVSCDFTSDDCRTGFCKGRYFCNKNQPEKHGKDIYHKKLLKDADIEYNREEKELTITVDKLKILSKQLRVKANIMEFEGNIHIEGDVIIKGNLTVDGTIHANGIIESSAQIIAPIHPTQEVPVVPVEEVNIQ